MPKPPPREFHWRRRIGVFTCLIMGSVVGWWIRDVSRARPPAAYAWVKPAQEEREGYFTQRWRRTNAEARVQAREGEYLYWLTPAGAEVVPGPSERRAPADGEKAEHPLWMSRADLRRLAFPETGESGRVSVLSPSGVTRYRNPIVDWVAAPGHTYDVAVIDAEDPLSPPRVLRGARPPLALLSLETSEPRPLLTGRIYEIYVREAGQDATLGGGRVLVADDAELEMKPLGPGPALFEAASAMRAKPYRTGDAWTRLQALPKGWAVTELARRTRLAVTLELGLPDEARKVRDELLK